MENEEKRQEERERKDDEVITERERKIGEEEDRPIISWIVKKERALEGKESEEREAKEKKGRTEEFMA